MRFSASPLGLAPSLRSRPVAEIFADESSQSGHHYLAIGACIVERTDLAEVMAALQDQRLWFGMRHELKWGKVAPNSFVGIRAMVTAFLRLVERDVVHFHTLIADCRRFDHRRYNNDDPEIGFNKLIYQLLLHRFGRRYGGAYRLEVRLDSRTSAQDPETIRPMLNAALARDWGIRDQPFRRIVFQDSKTSDLLQVTDLITGALAYRRNGRHRRPDASWAKNQLAEEIMRRAVGVEHPTSIVSKRAQRFGIWQFQLR